MCVTTDKDGLGVVFSPGKRELSCVSPRTRNWIRSCIFSREEGTVMCVTTDKDGLGVVFSPGRGNCHGWIRSKRELSCVTPGQVWIRSCIFSREEGTVMCVTTDKDGLGVVFSPGKRELSCVSPRMD